MKQTIKQPSLLRAVGEALYGPRWQSELARELGVSDRTVRRWDSQAKTDRDGEIERIPSGVWIDLLRLAQERAQTLGNLDDAIGNMLVGRSPRGSVD